MDTTFDEYARQSAQTSQDVGNIYAGINYLKHLDGEKHLVFVSEAACSCRGSRTITASPRSPATPGSSSTR